MKSPRWLTIPLILPLALAGLSGCSSDGGGESGALTIYTPNEQNMLDSLIPAFEEASGVKVSLVTAGTGELYQRIQSEAANPQGDVLFGGGIAQAMVNKDLWASYTSSNDGDMEDLGKNVGGYATPYQADGSNLLVNTDKVGDLKIESYADLLQPELKGQIAFGDPTNSSSAFAQLTNMLKAVGGDYTSDTGWDYVKDLVKQIDGNMIGSSSQVGQDTANGEYIVALTYEPLSLNLVGSGMPVEIVYPSEGAVYIPASTQIIKDAKNLEAAQKWIDWITSEQAQQILADNTNGRPVRKGITKEGLTPLSEIKTVTEDSEYVSAHREEIVAKYQEALAEV
jgi:iron(III) transport system substrate-binding protein